MWAFAPARATSVALAPAPALALAVAPALPSAFALTLAFVFALTPALAVALDPALAPEPLMQIRFKKARIISGGLAPNCFCYRGVFNKRWK